ncbi:MAG: hypothetical protein AAFN10_14925, partial [Bacteroidota bacterium]
DKGSVTEGVEKTITMKGMKNDKYLTIHVKAVGGISNKVDYKLKVTGEFNEEKLEEERSKGPVKAITPQTKPYTPRAGTGGN